MKASKSDIAIAGIGQLRAVRLVGGRDIRFVLAGAATCQLDR
jgi:hypothetical protein